MHDDHNSDAVVRAMTGSLGIHFGTTAPHTQPHVYVGHNGVYAALGSNVIVTVHVLDRDRHALIPVCRQAAFMAFGEAGLPTDGIAISPVVTVGGRTRMVVDENPHSASCGRRKRLQEQVMQFDLDRATRRLLTREEAQAYRTPLVPRHLRVLPDVTTETDADIVVFRMHTPAARVWVADHVEDTDDVAVLLGAVTASREAARDIALEMINADLKVK